jgi:hypothetical protein
MKGGVAAMLLAATAATRMHLREGIIVRVFRKAEFACFADVRLIV